MNKQTPISMRGAEPANCESIISRWKALTTRVNDDLDAGRDAAAAEGYHQALEMAETLFQAARDDRRAPLDGIAAIYNVSCHNLAELYHRRSDCLRAIEYYQRAFDRMLELVHSPDAPLDLRLACVAHLKRATIELIGYLQTSQGATPAQIARIINAARVASDHTANVLRREGNPAR